MCILGDYFPDNTPLSDVLVCVLFEILCVNCQHCNTA